MARLNSWDAWDRRYPVGDELLLDLWSWQSDICIELKRVVSRAADGENVDWDPHEAIIEIEMLQIYAASARRRGLVRL